MATTSQSFATRALRIHRTIQRNFVARILRRPGSGGASPTTSSSPSPPAIVRRLGDNALVVDVDAMLLKEPSSSALFAPYFLVAVEAGGYVRGLALLALYPLLRLLQLPHEARVRAMAAVAFCGLPRAAAARVGRAVLPKHFFREAADMDALESVGALPDAVKVAAVTRTFPTVMVEAFLKEYLGFDAVVGAGGQADAAEMLTLVQKQNGRRRKNSSGTYPRPVVFHDGRLAFTPTPWAALVMYLYLPFAVLLAVVRIAIYVLLPWRASRVLAALTGVKVRVLSAAPTAAGGRLYACNHRTLLDPIGIASALGHSVAAVTYSLGRLSEILSPLRLRRLTRDREEDRRRMGAMLAQGHDVAVCPEGTTCREPFLLRFSPLFAELAAEVTPVAIDTRTAMFYATSTSPIAKSFDSVYFLMNPRPEYTVRFLEPVSTEDGKSNIEVANEVQRVIAHALGFQGTALTRKDKYLLLAGNEGIVKGERSKS